MDIETIDREDEEIDIELTSDDPESNTITSTDSTTVPTFSTAANSANKQQDGDSKVPKQVTAKSYPDGCIDIRSSLRVCLPSILLTYADKVMISGGSKSKFR